MLNFLLKKRFYYNNVYILYECIKTINLSKDRNLIVGLIKKIFLLLNSLFI
ncbi:MAG: DUF986 family protein [Arsenophonus sp. NC-TX2-MAG3]